MANTEPSDTVEHMAARWVTRIDSHTLDACERKAFDLWVSNPAHKAAFLRLARHQQAIKASLKLPHSVRFSLKRWLSNKCRQLWQKPTWRYGLSSLSICLIAALILLNPHHKVEQLRYHTGIGETFSAVLSDGSTVTLNTNTALEITLTQAQRTLRLNEGEAYFEVAKDPNRPFTVHSGDHHVQAVGTAFSVRLAPDHTTQVTVTEGKVALGFGIDATSTPPSAYASAGQHAEMTNSAFSVAPSDAKATHKALAWRDGRIVFSGEPLATALQEFARYNPTPIVIKSPSLSQLPIGGYFHVNNAHALAQALAEEFDLKVIHTANGEIWLQTHQNR